MPLLANEESRGKRDRSMKLPGSQCNVAMNAKTTSFSARQTSQVIERSCQFNWQFTCVSYTGVFRNLPTLGHECSLSILCMIRSAH